ncbi:MAG: DUF4906 domain-containing protein [Alistipes sp.]|nr:DUF4906 domain-containing protein [Alistipes sp.]
MKRYFYILFVGVLLSLTSCVQEDIYVDDIYTPSANSGLQFVAAVEDFDKHNVATRAEGGVSDAHVSEMTMIIFKGDGTMLPAMDAEQNPLPSNHINIRRSNPTFLIEATRYKGTGIIASMEAGVTAKYYNNLAANLGECRIYIVANAYHLIGERLEAGAIQTEAQLLEALVATDPTLKMPKDSDDNPIGLPMIGTHGDDTFNLSYNAVGNNSVATISMKKLYSKVEFTIQVKSNQVVVGQTPKFTLEDIEIYNIPSQIRMAHVDGQYVDVICGGNLSDSNIANYYLYNSVNGKAKHLDLPSKTTAYHDTSVTTDEKIEFVFYMPEHMVTPNEIKYPNNITPDAKQYYKPAGVGQSRNGDGTTSTSKIAPYVRLIGSYTDHNAQINKVSYDIYLGQNNYNDFTVKRNQRLCNYVTITGLTNHKDAYPDVEGNVSIDHRVTMTSKGYNLSMEREAILDAHFEVRPLDVELSPGGSMTVVIPKEYKHIIAMESDAAARATGANTNLYVSTDKRKAVRKYFTTNLVSELWGGDESKDLTLTLKHSGELDENDKPKTEIHRIWFYVDENQNVYDETGTGPQTGENGYTVSTTLYRNAKVNFYYAADNATPDLSAEPSSTINFQQWNLWRVWNSAGTSYYDIEHEEEYLNNYACDQQYGSTQNGMPWGLDGVQLSNKYDAAMMHVLGEGLIQSIIKYFDIEDTYNGALSKLTTKPLYDFYLPRDISGDGYTTRSYSGLAFNAEIATTLKNDYASQQIAHTNSKGNMAQIEKLTLTQAPSSAFAYCYHKNKRNAEGDVVEQKWFLPAIDEIEDIAIGAYEEFDKVFQNQKYWSCQPAFESRLLHLDLKYLGYMDVADLEADYYIDDINRARATAAMYDGIDDNGKLKYKPLSSGTPGYSGTQTGTCNASMFSGTTIDLDENCKFTDFTNQQFIDSGNEGNLPRTQSCRIRAVYRSGTGTRSN